MKIKIVPQIRSKDKLWYEIEHQIIKVTVDGVSDTFDFRNMPDGELEVIDQNGNFLIETTLPETPILSARKENGELLVEILFSIDIEEDDNRLLFPEEMSLDEFDSLMDELKEKNKKRKEEKQKKLEKEKEIKELEEELAKPQEELEPEEFDG